MSLWEKKTMVKVMMGTYREKHGTSLENLWTVWEKHLWILYMGPCWRWGMWSGLKDLLLKSEGLMEVDYSNPILRPYDAWFGCGNPNIQHGLTHLTIIPTECGFTGWYLDFFRKGTITSCNDRLAWSHLRRIQSPLDLIYCYNIAIPSGYVKIAIENGHRNSGFSH